MLHIYSDFVLVEPYHYLMDQSDCRILPYCTVNRHAWMHLQFLKAMHSREVGGAQRRLVMIDYHIDLAGNFRGLKFVVQQYWSVGGLYFRGCCSLQVRSLHSWGKYSWSSVQSRNLAN